VIQENWEIKTKLPEFRIESPLAETHANMCERIAKRCLQAISLRNGITHDHNDCDAMRVYARANLDVYQQNLRKRSHLVRPIT